jgi:hypothetical protein
MASWRDGLVRGLFQWQNAVDLVVWSHWQRCNRACTLKFDISASICSILLKFGHYSELIEDCRILLGSTFVIPNIGGETTVRVSAFVMKN